MLGKKHVGDPLLLRLGELLDVHGRRTLNFVLAAGRREFMLA
ncbi:hypothetical protein SAMN05216337_10879 [Bradyrhizobium brasilense]|uniref:Uncharacterized protein n=1 Tax=Bradyrhizobium brasilense TaxID=1419277 RepID=A0A1G7PYJ9_9BRAD|nr:hypothetical protein SAMN05216337_10879 [Bradyrhizobium brasilense]